MGGRPEHNLGSHFGLLLPSSSSHSSGRSSEYRFVVASRSRAVLVNQRLFDCDPLSNANRMAACVANMSPPFVAASMIRSAATWADGLGGNVTILSAASPRVRKTVPSVRWIGLTS